MLSELSVPDFYSPTSESYSSSSTEDGPLDDPFFLFFLFLASEMILLNLDLSFVSTNSK